MPQNIDFESKETEEHWISISDLMSVLMIIFLFIAISYMVYVNKQKEQIQEIAITYSRLKEELYNDLYNEFKDNLDDWEANIDKNTISIQFLSPDVLFEIGSDIIKLKYKQILNDFFPRYIKILTQDTYKNDIEEIRIEGHTSSEWRINILGIQAYFNNMELSQDRTRSVLNYVFLLPKITTHQNWLKSILTANGLSSSKLIFTNGTENKNLSRRVEFRVRTNAEDRIVRIIEESQ